MERRHIGIDLHHNNFTCCVRLENGRNYLSAWKLEALPLIVRLVEFIYGAKKG